MYNSNFFLIKEARRSKKFLDRNEYLKCICFFFSICLIYFCVEFCLFVRSFVHCVHSPLVVFVIFVSIFIFIFGTIHAFPIYFFFFLFFLFRVLNMYGQSVYCVVAICRIFSIIWSNDLSCVADNGGDSKDLFLF